MSEESNICPKCKARLYVRHCLTCGFSRPPASHAEGGEGDKLRGDERAAMEALRQQNAEALGRVLAESGQQIPPDQLAKWRPTKRSTGQINGLDGLALTILATDGSRGIFAAVDALGRRYHISGHVEHFDGPVETLFTKQKSVDVANTKPAKPKKPSALQQALDLLNNL